MFYRLLVVAAFILSAYSCSMSKKAIHAYAATQDLDSVEVTVSRENPYRGFATKYFDLIHTKLEVKFDYQKQYLYGKAAIILKPHFYPQTELILDAKGFDIHEVSLVTGENSREGLQFKYDSLQIKISLNKKYTRDDTLKIYIDYTAKPNERKSGGSEAITDDKGLYFINPLGTDTNKPIQIWTQGETESSSCWFPTIDKPDQKCTDEIYITHLKKYVSLSNGVMVSSVPVNDSLVTDYWKMDLPQAPYLFMMAIGDFSIIHDHWRDIPVNYYVEKAYAPYAEKIFGHTPEMIEFFSDKLGFDYPWPKYSQIVVRDYVSGAMENTSATLHGEFIQRTPRELLDETYEDVISHELFHQWFGDLVTCKSWSNIPLNESFATYAEYLWNEYKYGREYADFKQHEDYLKYMQESKMKNVNLIRYHYDDREDMFDRHSYEKGGLVLHYLRNVVGDDAFFKSLELYLQTNQFKNVEIDNLRLAFETVTGKDMHWFFDEWFLNSGHPVVDIHYSYANDSVYVNIDQKHNISKELNYELPAQIAVWHGKDVSYYDVTLKKKKSQSFAFRSDSVPDLVDFDAKREVLCEKTENKTMQNYIFQYKHAPLFEQKLEALEYFSENQRKDPTAKETLTAAIADTFFYLREYALKNIELPKENNDSLVAVIQNLAQTDKISAVRKAALEKLSKLSNASKFTSLYETAVGDSSYEVAALALKKLDDLDSKKAMQYAKQFENERNIDMAAAVADVYSKEGDADYQSYFTNRLKSATGIGKYTMLYYYANFLTRMDKPQVLIGVKTIEEEAMATDSKFVLGGAKGSLKRIVKSFEDKRKKAQAELSSEQSQTAKIGLQESISNYDLIINDTNDALDRVNKKEDSNKN